MNGLLSPLLELQSFNVLLNAVKARTTPVMVSGVMDSQKCHVIYGLMQSLNRTGLIITYSELRAKDIIEDLKFFYNRRVKFYPEKDIIFYSADVKNYELTKQRMQVLDSLLNEESPIVVLSIEALLDRMTHKDIFMKSIIELNPGDEIALEKLIEQFMLIGYERVDIIRGTGQYAVRGGIVDIYPSNMNRPIRIEFWGDIVDSIRTLDEISQRSIENIDFARIMPVRELVYGQKELDNAISAIEKEFKDHYSQLKKKGLTDEAQNLLKSITQTTEKLKEQKTFNGIEGFFQYFYNDSISLLDYFPKDTLLFIDEPIRCWEHLSVITSEYIESVQNRILNGYLLPSQMHMSYDESFIRAQIQAFDMILLNLMAQTQRYFPVREVSNFTVKSSGLFNIKIDIRGELPFLDELGYLCQNGYRILILGGSSYRSEKIAADLREVGISATYYDNLDDFELPGGIVTVTKGSLEKGFEYPLIRFIVISQSDMFGEEKGTKKYIKKQKKNKIESFTDLKVGDYIVHDNHGVGIYKGIEQVVIDNMNRDYIKLEYLDGGKLFISTNQMDMIQKYIGGDGAKVKLNKLGGTDWSKAKARAKKSVEIMAKELVELYAKRQNAKGYIYESDTVWQNEFEEMFPYEETDDQLAAITDVKNDMESGKVMDRLICGDVGYGKTEVAIRAAFKTVQEGRQVAYLVPTTILAQQHYNTFVQRMKNYPVRTDMLSRFRTSKQQRETVEGLSKGQVDIVIGTHRLLSKDIGFKNLGLVIVDEEQRFGVGHKEKLKKLTENVNILTLTATPIPRTLHMSMTGIRDMSLLEEPPQERKAIQTYVMEYNPEFIRDAIHRELARNGQVFYLHNRVQNILETTKRVQKLVPEARVAYAHGQMTEHELENIMMDFVEGVIDVLVCTTIIETGLDIANVNTMIIEDADYMGLSQLYQLRGRVGRSNKIAYAYLTYKKDKVISETSEKRLQAIRDFTELGSGFKVSMRDLEIRGAGNLLGHQQHGYMDSVGYDMYCKLLAMELDKLKGTKKKKDFETLIDIKVDAYLPGYYIEDEMQKLEIYKKISMITDTQDYSDIQDEIQDRFGNIPKCVLNLLDIAYLKACAHKAMASSISQNGKNLIVSLLSEINIENIKQFIKNHKTEIVFTSSPSPHLTYMITGDVFKSIKRLSELLIELSEMPISSQTQNQSDVNIL